jgi:hypothetical protein
VTSGTASLEDMQYRIQGHRLPAGAPLQPISQVISLLHDLVLNNLLFGRYIVVLIEMFLAMAVVINVSTRK